MLPDVGSTMVPPGFSRPARSAASIIATAGRSLTLPPGFVVSSFTASVATRPCDSDSRGSLTIGVLPMRSRMESAISVPATSGFGPLMAER